MFHRLLCFVPVLTFGAVVATATPVNETVIFQTGFETTDSPGYTVGALNGQNGWCCSAVGTVENTTVFAGSQAVQFAASGTTGQNVDDHGLSYTATGNPNFIVTMSTEFMEGATGTSSLWDVLAAFGSPGFLGQLFVDNGVASLDGNGSVVVSVGVWNEYSLMLNFNTQTETAFVNGQVIASEPFATPATGLNPVQGLAFGINSSPGTDSGYWDDVSVVSTSPEPSSLELLFLGLVAAAVIAKSQLATRSAR